MGVGGSYVYIHSCPFLTNRNVTDVMSSKDLKQILKNIQLNYLSILGTSDSCNVSFPIKLVKIKVLIYQTFFLEICSPQLPITGNKFIF